MVDICVDFDGTLVDHAFPEVGKPVPYAKETILWLQSFDFVTLILLTMRSHDMRGQDYLADAIDYCTKQGMIFDHFNENPSQYEWTSSRKVYANIYIDNANIGCPLITIPGFYRPCVDWKIVRSQLEQVLASKGYL